MHTFRCLAALLKVNIEQNCYSKSVQHKLSESMQINLFVCVNTENMKHCQMSKSCTKCKLSIVLSNQSMHPTVNLAVSGNPTITLLIKCDHKCSLKTFSRHSGVVLAPVTYRKYVEHGASSIFFSTKTYFIGSLDIHKLTEQ